MKAGLNYAMSLHASVTAHAAGYDENMFLDPGTRTFVEETGGANFLFVTGDGEVVTPKSDSILPSITRRSLVYVAEHLSLIHIWDRIYYKLLRKIIAGGQERGQLTTRLSVSEMVKRYALCERALMYDWCLCGGEYSLGHYSAEVLPGFLSSFLP